MNDQALLDIIGGIVSNLKSAISIPIGISNKHIHLSQADFQKLFPNKQMTVLKELNQPGEFASEQTVTAIGPKGELRNIRILGPFRKESQVEFSMTDARQLGLKLPIRLSGEIEHTPGITLKSEFGECTLEKGVIVAKRHIHMSPADAKLLQVTQGECVNVRVNSEGRSIIFEDCAIRIGEKFKLEMHIDTDEANAGNITPQSVARFVE
ncbi:phosphate propanoyltransferase [Evansella sp. AB-rgal1]|uniref:phosphate propanoyltransferase n=1 Tax=Evansella sp. AB-rgal1 TaxID=3242696 RepID=UPI00359E5916